MVYDLLGKQMNSLNREHFMVLHLNGKNNIIAKETISIGSLNQSIVQPREVFQAAVIHGSTSLVLVHNHPSGDPDPSMADFATTHRLRHASEIMGIKILDHIIIGTDRYFSLVEYETKFEIARQEGAKYKRDQDRRVKAAQKKAAQNGAAAA
jgi:DNA repair protein RadC